MRTLSGGFIGQATLQKGCCTPSWVQLDTYSSCGMQGGAQSLERAPAPRSGLPPAPPGLPKFRASGQILQKNDKVCSRLHMRPYAAQQMPACCCSFGGVAQGQ